MKGTMTAGEVHKQYNEIVTAFRKLIPDPALRLTFSRQVDGYMRQYALGVWQADNASAITPRHVEFYNAVYSAGNPVPSALYWEVATGVAGFDLFQPPAFFQDLLRYDRMKGTTLARRFADQLTLVLLLLAAVDDVVSESEAGFVNSCNDTLLHLCDQEGLRADRPALKADDFIARRPVPPPSPAQPQREEPAEKKEEGPATERPKLEELLAELDQLGLLTLADEPLLGLVACTGSATCARGLADSKHHALHLAELLRESGARPQVHLSACPRSCASARVQPYTLLASTPDHYQLYQRTPEAPGFGRLLAPAMTIDEAGAWFARQHPAGTPDA